MEDNVLDTQNIAGSRKGKTSRLFFFLPYFLVDNEAAQEKVTVA